MGCHSLFCAACPHRQSLNRWQASSVCNTSGRPIWAIKSMRPRLLSMRRMLPACAGKLDMIWVRKWVEASATLWLCVSLCSTSYIVANSRFLWIKSCVFLFTSCSKWPYSSCKRVLIWLKPLPTKANSAESSNGICVPKWPSCTACTPFCRLCSGRSTQRDNSSTVMAALTSTIISNKIWKARSHWI